MSDISQDTSPTLEAAAALAALRRRRRALDRLVTAFREYLEAGGGLPLPGVCRLCPERGAEGALKRAGGGPIAFEWGPRRAGRESRCGGSLY